MNDITIIIPVYNRENFLHAAIESCIRQTIPIKEIIIIDNNSHDLSFQIAKDFEKKFSNIKAVRNKKNIGMIGNWNKGIRLASNKYVSILHSDDILDVQWHERVIKGINETKHIDVGVFFGIAVKVIQKDKLIKKEVLQPFTNTCILPPKISINKLWKRCYFNINTSGAIIYTKSAIEHAGYFDTTTSYEADIELHIKILNRQPAYYINDNLVYYRIHKEQGSYSRNKSNKLSSTITVMKNSISIQKRYLEEKSLISYYYSYIFVYAILLLLQFKIKYSLRMIKLIEEYRIKSVLNSIYFIYYKIIIPHIRGYISGLKPSNHME